MGDFIKECKKKHAEGKTDFVPALIMYASMLENQEELRKLKKEREINDRRLNNVFSGNY